MYIGQRTDGSCKPLRCSHSYFSVHDDEINATEVVCSAESQGTTEQVTNMVLPSVTPSCTCADKVLGICLLSWDSGEVGEKGG